MANSIYMADILPIDATNKTVMWSVQNDTGVATIDPVTGELFPESEGTIKVIATATDGSDVTGEKVVNIVRFTILIENITVIGDDETTIVSDVTPYDHQELNNLDYENSGHTGFATQAQGEKADTALQSESDPIYLADKPNIATVGQLPDITGLATKDELTAKTETVTTDINTTLTTNYMTADEVRNAIAAGGVGIWTDKGSVNTRTELPATANDFDIYLIKDEGELLEDGTHEGLDVYARNDPTLTWHKLNFSIGDLDYETIAGATQKMDLAVSTAKSYTDTVAASKLSLSGKAADSALLNGKSDTAFATAAQGTLATNAMPKSGGTATGAIIGGGSMALGTAQFRNIIISTTDLTPGVSPLATGTLYFVYTP